MTLCSMCGEGLAELRVDISHMRTEETFYVKTRICRACAMRITQMINEEWGE